MEFGWCKSDIDDNGAIEGWDYRMMQEIIGFDVNIDDYSKDDRRTICLFIEVESIWETHYWKRVYSQTWEKGVNIIVITF